MKSLCTWCIYVTRGMQNGHGIHLNDIGSTTKGFSFGEMKSSFGAEKSLWNGRKMLVSWLLATLLLLWFDQAQISINPKPQAIYTFSIALKIIDTCTLHDIISNWTLMIFRKQSPFITCAQQTYHRNASKKIFLYYIICHYYHFTLRLFLLIIVIILRLISNNFQLKL